MSDRLAGELARVLADCGARRKLARIAKQGLTSDILVYHRDVRRLVDALEEAYPGLLDRVERQSG